MAICRLKRIIVNADDLGESLAINDEIFSRIESGKITSATILANGEAVADAATRCARFPNASFGVHLNATDGYPLAPTSGLAPILNESGRFDGDKLRRVSINSTLREALYVEWAAQISRLIDAGVPVSHFDGHHHIHTTPGVFRVVKRLQRHFGIRKVRISRNLYSESSPPRTGSLLWKKSIWNFALRFIPPFTITTQFLPHWKPLRKWPWNEFRREI